MALGSEEDKLAVFLYVPRAHSHHETGSMASGTHTGGTSVRPWWFSKLRLPRGLHRSKQPPREKGPCSGAVGILFFLVFWHAKLKSLVNQIPRANTCSLHTGPLKPKLLPNYSGCFLLFIGKEWWPSTRGQQQAPGTCSSTSKFISVTLGGTGLSNEGLIRTLSVCTPRHAICCIFQP